MTATITHPVARPVTLSDVASRAGVSLNTASRVLNGRVKGAYPKAQKRVKRIQQIADELGYRANTAARAVASGQFHAIGFLFRDDGSAVGSSVVYGVNQVLRERNFRLVLSPLHGVEDLTRGPAVLRELSVDGLLVSLMQDVDPGFRQAVDDSGTPVVWVNTKLAANAVRPDDEGMVRQLVRHLLGMGHRRIAYLAGNWRTAHHYSARDRHAGYCNAMRDAGLEPLVVDRPAPDDRRALVDQVLSLDPRPTAVVCGRDDLAHPLLYVAALRRIATPGQLSVAAVTSSPRDPLGAGLTGIEVPFRAMGEVAARMLHARIETGEPQPSQVVEGRFAPGATAAVCPSD